MAASRILLSVLIAFSTWFGVVQPVRAQIDQPVQGSQFDSTVSVDDHCCEPARTMHGGQCHFDVLALFSPQNMHVGVTPQIHEPTPSCVGIASITTGFLDPPRG